MAVGDVALGDALTRPEAEPAARGESIHGVIRLAGAVHGIFAAPEIIDALVVT